MIIPFLQARRRFHRLRGEALTRYQHQAALRAVNFAVHHAPFYRRHFSNHRLNDWQRLPTVDKALMMANFDTFNTCGVSREDALVTALAAERDGNHRPLIRGLTVGLSSGTSGHR